MTRRTRFVAAAAATALTLGLAAPAAHAEEAPPSLPTAARLGCRAVVMDGAPKAVCEWSVGLQEYGTVELWRGTGENGQLTRVKVFETADHGVRRHVDATVQVGTRYGYVLVVLGPDGAARARSNLSVVGVAPPVEVLQLACRRTEPRTIRCEWRTPSSATASSLTLWSAVNRDGRTVQTTVTPPAAGSFDITIPPGTWAIRIGLTATDADGNLIGRSPAVTFAIGRPRR